MDQYRIACLVLGALGWAGCAGADPATMVDGAAHITDAMAPDAAVDASLSDAPAGASLRLASTAASGAIASVIWAAPSTIVAGSAPAHPAHPSAPSTRQAILYWSIVFTVPADLRPGYPSGRCPYRGIRRGCA